MEFYSLNSVNSAGGFNIVFNFNGAPATLKLTLLTRVPFALRWLLLDPSCGRCFHPHPRTKVSLLLKDVWKLPTPGSLFSSSPKRLFPFLVFQSKNYKQQLIHTIKNLEHGAHWHSLLPLMFSTFSFFKFNSVVIYLFLFLRSQFNYNVSPFFFLPLKYKI